MRNVFKFFQWSHRILLSHIPLMCPRCKFPCSRGKNRSGPSGNCNPRSATRRAKGGGCGGWKDAGSLELQEKHGAYKAIKPKRYIMYQNPICKTYMHTIYMHIYIYIHRSTYTHLGSFTSLVSGRIDMEGIKGFGSWVI